MGCNCAKGKKAAVKHQVTTPAGKTLTFLTASEATTAAANLGGTYKSVPAR